MNRSVGLNEVKSHLNTSFAHFLCEKMEDKVMKQVKGAE